MSDQRLLASHVDVWWHTVADRLAVLNRRDTAGDPGLGEQILARMAITP